MERFAILVDSSADLTQQEYDAMHIDGFIPLSFSIDGKEYLSYPDERELTAGELYATLRNTKAVVGTSQPNPAVSRRRSGSSWTKGGMCSTLPFPPDSAVPVRRQTGG